MKVFIGCERSGRVRDAFTARGHDAISCDYFPSETPGKHYQGSIFDPEVMKYSYDLGIFFPDCTFLTVSGNRWFEDSWRFEARLAAIHFVRAIWQLTNFRNLAIENPIGVLSTTWRRPCQIIQPWQFGHGETKATCLWFRGLPYLKPTNIVDGREGRVWKEPPGPDRKINRSRTYEGIAAAMAEQWGNL